MSTEASWSRPLDLSGEVRARFFLRGDGRALIRLGDQSREIENRALEGSYEAMRPTLELLTLTADAPTSVAVELLEGELELDVVVLSQ